MSLLDDPEKILKESDEVLKLENIIKEKDAEIEQYKQYFDYIHNENAKLKQKLYDIYHGTSARWINNDSNDLLFERNGVFKLSPEDTIEYGFDYGI